MYVRRFPNFFHSIVPWLPVNISNRMTRVSKSENISPILNKGTFIIFEESVLSKGNSGLKEIHSERRNIEASYEVVMALCLVTGSSYSLLIFIVTNQKRTSFTYITFL